MHNIIKKIVTSIISVAMATASTVSAVTPFQTMAVQVLGETSFDNKSLPWQACSSSPAKQDFEIKDGEFHIRILVPSGADREKWDLQFRHRSLSFKKGHEYKVSFKAKSNRNGFELCSKIGNLKGDEEYFELDGESNDMHMGPSMGGRWPSAPAKLTTDWQSFEGVFKPTEDLTCCEWVFMYAKGTNYQGNAQEGDEIWFDDMSIDCLTCDENPVTATCGWTGDKNLGIIIPQSDVRINQLGYYITANKKATYVTEKDKDAIDFRLLDKNGETVYTGKSEPAGYDKMSGEFCHIIDFSKFNTPGEYTIVMNDEKDNNKNISHEFIIGNDIYENTLRNALNYYYQKRSGSDIESNYVTSGDKKALSHMDVLKTDLAYVQPKWYNEYYAINYDDFDKKVSLDVSGGWYDPENHSKSISSGATTVWLLQNMYESSKKGGTDCKWADGKSMSIPSDYNISKKIVNCNDTPDILDEARYELEFMFKMIVDPKNDSKWGEKYSGFVYDQVRNYLYEPVPYSPLDYIDDGLSPRIINPPTYSATFNMIACAAQAARLWKGIDDEFAEECLDNAIKSWKSIIKYKDVFEYNNSIHGDEAWRTDPHFVPFTSYHNADSFNSEVDDEAYWAACELFATTGDDTYYDYLKEFKSKKTSNETKQCFAFGIPTYLPMLDSEGIFSSFDRNNKIGCGTLSLYLSNNTPDADKNKIRKNLIDTADMYLDIEDDKGINCMGVPYKKIQWLDRYTYPSDIYTSGYGIGSNSTITNNALIMAYAYNATEDKKYLNGTLQALDYIFGRNGLDFSYVTGCGSYHTNNPVDEYWGYELDKTFPMSPDGVMVGGPYTWIADNYVRAIGLDPDKTPPQKCYADSIEAWSVNSPALDWQASLIWNMSFLEDVLGNEYDITTKTTTMIPSDTTSTTSTTTSSVTTSESDNQNLIKGDTNCDGQLDMSDAVLIMQSLANPNKYGIDGTAEHHLTELGKLNGDMNGDGLTVGDAQTIQRKLLGLIDNNIDNSAIAGMTYLYEKEGFGGDFEITFNIDGTFQYSIGYLSSYIGSGTWEIMNTTVVMTENISDKIYHLKKQDDKLIYIADISDDFDGIKVKDGEKFFAKNNTEALD